MSFFTPGIRRFWLVAISVAAVVSALASVDVFLFQYIRSTWEVVAGARAERARLERQQADVIEASRAAERLQLESALIQGSFADPSTPLPVIETIEALGARLGVRTELALGGLSAGGVGRGSARVEEYRLSAEGAFPNVVAMFERLESLPFLVELRDASLDRIGDVSPGEPLVRLTATIRLITLPARTQP